MNRLLSKMVRAYLYRMPITEGKSRLLSITEKYIRPDETTVVSRTKDDFLLWLNLANHEHRRIYYYGEHDERYELALLRKIIRPGDVCWDIGANIGFYTTFFARMVGVSGKVIAFEPVAGTRQMLEKSIHENDFMNVQVIPAALSDAERTAEIFYSDEQLG